MTVQDIIDKAEARHKELEHKGWDWRSFYNGYLEGAVAMMESQWHPFPETEPPKPGLYLVIKNDKGHGRRVDRMRWYAFTSAVKPEIRAITCGWGGNYGSSVTHWRAIPDLPPEKDKKS